MTTNESSAEQSDVDRWISDPLDESRIIFGAIGGLSLAFIIQLSAATTPLKWQLELALYCCALLVPFSIIGFRIKTLEIRNKRRLKTPIVVIRLLFVVMALSFTAIGAVFWYFSVWMMALYGLCLFLACWYFFAVRQQFKPSGAQAAQVPPDAP